MSEQEAAYIAQALAEGQLLTEAGTEALMNQMIHVEEEVSRETLEQTVLKLWEYDSFLCRVCGFNRFRDESGHLRDVAMPHAPDCIVPALLEKYA